MRKKKQRFIKQKGKGKKNSCTGGGLRKAET
jgi:hypothetical protein